jgi:imidazolonepropionase-like amidohydrolase
MTTLRFCAALLLSGAACAQTPIVLRAARLLDIETGKILKPGEVLVTGERIVEAGAAVTHPAGAEIIDWATAPYCPV